jgi:hypothetical protein
VTHSTIARALLALLCGLQGAGTLAVDLNRTHATNPSWPQHARFHLVWQAISYALLSMIETALILIRGPFQNQRFYLAAALAAIPMLSFFTASISRSIYGGALLNADGIAPVRISIFNITLQIDLNLTAEIVALLFLVAIVALFRL